MRKIEGCEHTSNEELSKKNINYTEKEVNNNNDRVVGMKCPVGWHEIDGSSLGIALIFVEPQEDMTNASINLLIEDLSQKKMSLETYTNLTVEYLLSNLKDLDLIENTTCFLGQYDASKIVFSGKFVTNEIEHTLQWLQVMTIFEDKAYVVTFTSQPSQYDNYLDIVEETLASFEIN